MIDGTSLKLTLKGIEIVVINDKVQYQFVRQKAVATKINDLHQ